jgi:hypothetical protein
MKKLVVAVLLVVSACTAFAQSEEDSSEEEKGGFKKEYLFSGGNINLSFFSGVTVLGASPQLGYSVTNWLDAGVIFGYTYSSERDPYNNDKYRQTIIGPGAFARLFPVNFLFASVQFEHNFIRQKYLPASGVGGYTYKVDANSLLIGAGYTSGRSFRNSPYYYFSVSVDVINNEDSPYTDRFNNLLPVIVAGFNIPLFQGKRSDRDY